MEIQIIEGSHGGLQVTIKCEKVNEEVLRLKSHINRFRGKLTAKRDHETVFVELSEVLYFESVDNRTFLYTSDEVMEIKHRLWMAVRIKKLSHSKGRIKGNYIRQDANQAKNHHIPLFLSGFRGFVR